MEMDVLIKIVAFSPLLSFVINGIGGKSFSKSLNATIASLGVFVSFIAASLALSQLWQEDHHLLVPVFDWISAGTLDLHFDFLVDRLTSIFLMMITGIGFLIHVYSFGYMYHDESIRRFFSYLNLFVFCMLVLVMGDNFLVTFVGWEGVGFSSFMLIGFWYKDMKNNDAAKKAFVMNRIGDFGYLMAMCLLLVHMGTLKYQALYTPEAMQQWSQLPGWVIPTIALLLFLGSTGKSAQIPLYTWLPDAMAGPTPVSALIHAATMVTAGIYLVARNYPLFEAAPDVSVLIAWVGMATAALGAAIAVKQTDIKKVLAYSTVSQLGLMFVALGIGAYKAAIFHVLTHAFFKALLFLGAGSVIHGLSNEQDIRKMGGIRSKMPVTYWTFLIGTIAIAGIPPLAGFFSKDLILAAAFEKNTALYVLALGVSLLTAFYMFRLFFLTFAGNYRGPQETWEHAHESPWTMTLPLLILAFFSITGGWIGLPHGIAHAMHWDLHIDQYLGGVLPKFELHAPLNLEIGLMAMTTVLIGIAIYASWTMYAKKGMLPARKKSGLTGWRRFVTDKFYVDEFYYTYVTRPMDRLSEKIEKYFDNAFLNGMVNGIGQIWITGGKYLRVIQTGQIEHYIIVFILGVAVLLALILF